MRDKRLLPFQPALGRRDTMYVEICSVTMALAALALFAVLDPSSGGA
jgi:hypothetical protein